MAFSDLLEQVGSTGRFQVVHVTLLSLPILMMASHNLLQNFVAAVPPHHCATHANISGPSLRQEDILLISIPLDQVGRPERCRRYAQPQWFLLYTNSSEGLEREMEENEIKMQGCVDGWKYNMSEMSSTIITEVDDGDNLGLNKKFKISNATACIDLSLILLPIILGFSINSA